MAILVSAIHLGRSSVQWAFSSRCEFESDPKKAFTRQWFASGSSLMTSKAPFCLLVEPDRKSLSFFGFDAENKYAELRETDEHKPYYFCTDIAGSLERKYRQEKTNVTEITIEDEMGKSLPALTVLTLVIQYMKNDIQRVILQRCVDANVEEDMYIVLTVPPYLQGSGAIELVRKAALNCRICAGKLSIITDLDAASIFYQHATIRELNPALCRRPKAMRYLIVKAGVTTDVVVHESDRNGLIKEASPVRTYEFGATLVDKAVENFFKELFGVHVFDKFKATMPEDYLDLLREVEVKKRCVLEGRVSMVKLRIPITLVALHKEETRKTLQESVNISRYSRDVDFLHDKLRLSANVFRSFFNKAHEWIISMITTTFRNTGECDLLVCGGLANSDLLQQVLQLSFPNISISFHEDTLKGALVAGHALKRVKKMETTTKAIMVAAIDFGTTYSGWAISLISDFESDRTKASVRKWHSGSTQTEKTPTCVLIRPDGKTMEAFGYDAENRYKDLIEAGEHLKYYYFQRFKMLLNKKLGEKLNRKITLEDEMGRSLPAIDVFALCIKYLKEDALSGGNKRLVGSIPKEEVHWVLTVPAIWTDGAKQFMREAAIKAGIESKRLTIALEPEAASIYCRHLSVETTVGHTGASVSSFKAGTRYMILDAGGGTIDITVHEVDINNGVKEVHSADGGGYGGTMVDKEFEKVLIALLGLNTYQQYKRKNIEDWLELWRDFEVKKRAISPEEAQPLRMKLPLSLIETYGEETKRKLEDDVRKSEKYSKDIQFSGDKIKFSEELTRSFFSESVSKTISLVKDTLGDIQVTAILMVGGYSESPMLQQAIRSAFPDIEVVVPLEASYSIMKGALIFGHLPRFITKRVLKYTYGIGTTTVFVKGKHPENKRFHTDTGDRCDLVFHKHVEKGQSVSVGEPQVRKTYNPVYKQQKRLGFSVFASKIPNPEYTNQNCNFVGKMSVELGDDGDLDREVLVALTFSDTEIVVEATEKKTGKETYAAIDFLG